MRDATKRYYRQHPVAGWEIWDRFAEEWQAINAAAQAYLETKRDVRAYIWELYKESGIEVPYQDGEREEA